LSVLVAGVSVPIVLGLRDQVVPMIVLLVAVIGVGATAIVYVLVRLLQFYYLVIDRNVGIFDSFRLSWDLTRNRVSALLIIYVLQMAIVLAGLLMCLVGVVWAAPLATLLLVVTYLAWIGEAAPAAKPSLETWEEEP
jgi:hypothetical protein